MSREMKEARNTRSMKEGKMVRPLEERPKSSISFMERQQLFAFEPLSPEATLFFSCKMFSGETLPIFMSSFCIRSLICNGQGVWNVCSGMPVKTNASLVSGFKVTPWSVLLISPKSNP